MGNVELKRSVWEDLSSAVTNNQLEKVEQLTERGPPMIMRIGDRAIRHNLLHVAVSGGNLPIIETLLRRRAYGYIYSTDENEQTPFQIAITSSNLLVTRLLARYADRTTIQEAFNFALARMDVPATTVLLEHGAFVNRALRYWGPTPLHLVVERENASIEMVTLLLQHGAALDSRAYSEWHSPLHIAVRFGNTAAVAAFLEAGANVNESCRLGETALHLAVTNARNAPLISLLLQNGACLNDLERTQLERPLHVAVRMGFTDTAKQLLDWDDEFHKRIARSSGNHVDSTVLLQSDGKQIWALTRSGSSVLHLAVENFDMIRMLVRNGAGTRVKDNNGQTPQDVAEAVGADPLLVHYLGSDFAVVLTLASPGHVSRLASPLKQLPREIVRQIKSFLY